MAFRQDDADFHVEPARSYTIPARYYYDPAIYELETEAIFFKGWWLAGHKSQLATPGCYITTRIFDQSIAVIHGEDGTLRAFYNVWQHRCHELLQGAGSTPVIVCPYHAWSYRLDGSLRRARNSQDMPDFDPADFGLSPVQVEEFCGFVFVNLDPAAAPLAQQSGGLGSEIRHYVPRIDDLTFARRYEYRVESNWKVLIDNFLECYHCAPAHKDFVELVDMPSYRSKAQGIYSSHISSKMCVNDQAVYKVDPASAEFGFAGWYLWPNLTMGVLPGEPNLFMLQMIPDGPEHTIEYWDWYLLDPTPSAQIEEAMAYVHETLQPEDIGICESVQRGLRSRGYNQGRFVVDKGLTELSEHAVHHFQQMVVEALGVRPTGG